MRTRRNTGFSVLALAAIAIPLMAIIGISIDTGIMYLIKGKLSAAVDAGALAGARALSRGDTGTAQETRAKAVADGYVKANFKAGYMMSRNLTIPVATIDTTVANQRSLSLTANVEAPVLFLGIVGASRTVVRAAATAVRRDVNVMLILDRSTSLQDSDSCGDLRLAANRFVGQFANLRDNVGLVTFGTSSYAEFPMANNFTTASPSVPTMIGNIVCNGGTASADGLSRGYWNLANLLPYQPLALNVIVFFTDGQPTAVSGNFTMKATGTDCALPLPRDIPGVWLGVLYLGTPVRRGLMNPSHCCPEHGF